MSYVINTHNSPCCILFEEDKKMVSSKESIFVFSLHAWNERDFLIPSRKKRENFNVFF